MDSSGGSENKSLLIIKSQAQGLTGVENFLKNREWKLFSTIALKDALAYMVQNQPAFVMISVDHPNKKVRKLAKVLPQAFPCCVIMFAEQTIPASIKALAETRAEYMLNPPATGPAVERTVNKFYKDQSRKLAAGQNLERGKFGESEEKVISIKGENVSAQSLLAQLMGDDVDNGGSYYDPSHVGHYNPQAGGRQTQGPLHHNSQDPNAGKNKPPGYRPPHEGLKQGGYLPSDDELSPTTKNQRDSIILKGTKEALEKSVVRGAKTTEEVQFIEQASNVACIVIESTRFSGYLVAAMAQDRKMDEKFIDRVREKLFKFLSDNGEQVDNGKDTMQIKIKQVPFEDWAVECAEFLRKSVHNGEEVAMAFFPHADIKAHFQESASEMMLAISLGDIKADESVEFNLYVYLERNQKYVLYTPRGGKIYQKQIDKLADQGVRHVHMFKSDVQDFNKYRAQNYLNGKIEEYQAAAEGLAVKEAS
ncbi:hypothetical protein AZI86_00380 [Bdellovibrio bacteriovorus]|uniref:Uncharacterized protein n=1 Tax=Bdellovibrio bacteriovorus TaxID=959 RepID=A0A150WM88_BDEBC|nr:hypothetical protein [Bdellovibrio bacteriovorus]KYG65572.1 hypothetical protein AZI86_00380 [Bdellovibrio bacteriovorus]